MEIRRANKADHAFVVEMARLACSLEGRHLVPAADAAEVIEMMPGAADVALIAASDANEPVGAAWCYQHDVPLLRDRHGQALPELAIAVQRDARGHGIGTALIEALARNLKGHASAVTLNVHVLNPAVRLYVRTGFRVVGRGRGWYGVAMSRPLDQM